MYRQEGKNVRRKCSSTSDRRAEEGKTRRCLNLPAANNGEITGRKCQVDRKENKKKGNEEKGAVTPACRRQR